MELIHLELVDSVAALAISVATIPLATPRGVMAPVNTALEATALAATALAATAPAATQLAVPELLLQGAAEATLALVVSAVIATLVLMDTAVLVAAVSPAVDLEDEDQHCLQRFGTHKRIANQ